MKKASRILSLFISGLMAASCFPLTASAVPDLRGKTLPFELEAPTNTSLTWINGNDSETTMNIAYSMNNSMCQWLSEYADPNTHDETLDKLLKDYQIYDLYINAMIDWAIDDPVNGWHYNEYWAGEEFTNDEGNHVWAGLGYDKDYNYRLGDWDEPSALIYPETTNETWIYRSGIISHNPEWPDEENERYNEWFYGNDLIPGLKNQLKDDQYTIVEADPETHDQKIVIDWTKHTAYARVRWVVTVTDENNDSIPILSDWSEIAAFGKDAVKFEPLTKESLAPPVISDLRYYKDKYNDYPQIAVNLTVPDDLSKALTEVTSRGGTISIEWEARIPEGEWVTLHGDWLITGGENIVSLQSLGESIKSSKEEYGSVKPGDILPDGTPIELRARYWCNQYESYNGDYIGEFWSDYSEVISFGYDDGIDKGVIGDANIDGVADIADALKIARYDCGLAEISDSRLPLLEVTGDGSVDIADALKIARYDAGIIDSLT